MVKNIKAVILAAGLGTRMKSSIPKVLHPLCGRPMVEYVLGAVRSSGIKDIVCVVGHKADMVKGLLKGVKIVRQKRPLGSADALKETKGLFKNFIGDLLVLYGDNPLIKQETLKNLISQHRKNKNSCTLLSARMDDPTGYGRIIRDDAGNIAEVVEETEGRLLERLTKEVNTGTYCFKSKELYPILNKIKNDNKKREYFLTDAVSLMRKKNLKVDSAMADDNEEILGINSRKDLAVAERILRKRVLAILMEKGVTIVDPDLTYIDKDVDIGRDTIIYPSTIIDRNVKIGKNCKIGPFARIRPGCILKDGVAIGNFVELVRTKIDKQTKVKHQAYLGDAIIGKGVNIGAGTITANYDGKGKYVTRIGDGAFIGSGTIFIAPVKVGRYATTGAGAVVTKNHDVPPRTVVVGIPARPMVKRIGKRKKMGVRR